MIIDNFLQSRANKLTKISAYPAKEPVDMEILWLLYEDFNHPSEFFIDNLHKHTFYELHFILEGRGIITDNCRKEYSAVSGEAILVPKDMPHAFKFKKENLKRLSVAFTLPEGLGFEASAADFAVIALGADAIEKLNTVFANADKNTVLSLCVIRNRLFEIIFELLNLEKYAESIADFEADRNNLYVEKSKKYIIDNLNIILTCKNIADYCHISEIYLNRLFKKYTGETLCKYIQRKKIDYSIELLKNRELSLSEISGKLGFPNEYYFNTYFRKAVGMPPGTYRNIKIKPPVTKEV